MPATIQITDGTFTVNNNPDFRAQPEKEWAHRLMTRAHLNYLGDEKLFNVGDSRWAQQTIDGEVCYGHEYEGCLLVVRLKTADGKLNLSHNKDGSFDRYLMDLGGQNVVYSLTSSNNGVESTHTFSTTQAGVASIPIICVCLAMTCSYANAAASAEAAVAGEEAVLTLCGVEVEVTTVPVVGIILAILGLIGMWIVWAIEVEIMLNLIYENRSKQKTISLVDRYFYNIGDHNPAGPVTLDPLQKSNGFEFYSDVVITVDNNSKFRGGWSVAGISKRGRLIPGHLHSKRHPQRSSLHN
ncbi:MAG: hypothetical protein HC936_17525 [Leptolyngbyaceae cyanobacterium SU_3_3]|nr:hypothetical protein [Leptolyngbyaceae cyanobacterium SU_3_3]